jgi:trigger factor
VTVSVRDAGPFEKLVSFTVGSAELEAAKSKAARRLSQQVSIRGFRPGKAPRPIVEATVGAERIRSEAIDDLLPEKLGDVLRETDLAPAVTPELEQLDETPAGLAVEVRVTLWPKLDRVPEHHGRTIQVGSPAVSDDEVDAQLERLRDQFAQLETAERPAAAGDFVAIDISATHEGADVPEAQASQLLYEVGSESFVEGMDAAVVGAAAGDAVHFDGELPAGFGERAGLAVTFTVTVTEVRRKVLPELTDEWVDDTTEFGTIAELRTALGMRIGELKRRSAAARFRRQALDDLVDQVDLELPDGLVRAEMDELLHRFAHRLEEQGVTLEDYFRVTGIDQSAFVDDLRNQAVRSLRSRLLLEAVAERDGLAVDDAELSAVVDAIAARTEQPDQARVVLRQRPREQSLVGDILRSKALDAIVAGATPVDDDGNVVDLTVTDEESALPADVEAEVVEAEVVGPVAAEVVEAMPAGAEPGGAKEE